MTEKQIRNIVKKFLKLNGWFVFHVLQGLGCYPGISDFIACRKGEVVFIEIKTEKGRQSLKQKHFQRQIESAGCTYIIARNYDDVKHLGNTLF